MCRLPLEPPSPHPTPPTTRNYMLPRKYHEHEKPPQNPPQTAPKPTQNHPKPAQAVPRPVRWVACQLGFFLRRCPRGSRAAPPPLSRMAARGSPHGSPLRDFPYCRPSAPAPPRPVPPSALGFPVAFVRSHGLACARSGRRPRLDAGDSGGERLPESPAEISCYRVLYLVPLSPPWCFFSFSGQTTTLDPPACVPELGSSHAIGS